MLAHCPSFALPIFPRSDAIALRAAFVAASSDGAHESQNSSLSLNHP
jgi:hypothetical protein